MYDTIPLQDWKRYWRGLGAGDVLWAQDLGGNAVSSFNVTALGTTIIIDREGRMVYRDAGATSYERLREEVERALNA